MGVHWAGGRKSDLGEQMGQEHPPPTWYMKVEGGCIITRELSMDTDTPERTHAHTQPSLPNQPPPHMCVFQDAPSHSDCTHTPETSKPPNQEDSHGVISACNAVPIAARSDVHRMALHTAVHGALLQLATEGHCLCCGSPPPFLPPFFLSVRWVES